MSSQFHICLYEPEIPHNCGAIGRLALACDATLHLVEPLGFSLDDKMVQRAGLDYWDSVKLQRWPNWLSFWQAIVDPERVFFATTKTSRRLWDCEYRAGDTFVFGRETKGLPESLLNQHQERCITIPMEKTRSLNLAISAGVVLFEAVRQVSLT